MDQQGGTLVEMLSRKVVGQPAAMEYIVPYLQMYQAGLSPADRPAGIFLLLGPTGTGKTRTVEALAEVLHGSAKSVLKIDCGEFQSDHEVAKLIGAPPGYLGHRETTPVLTQERLVSVGSATSDLSLVLFDEVEKAAPALTVLLLGMLDKGTLTLGDNTVVNFEKTFIFLTSNLGAREMMKESQPELGFKQKDNRTPEQVAGRLESIGLAAVRRRFSPEFVNRIDVVITYQPLDAESVGKILDHHVEELQRHVYSRLGEKSFEIEVTPGARELLLQRGISPEYGARELKRTIHRLLTQPLAALVASGGIVPGTRVVAEARGDTIAINPLDEPARTLSARRTATSVLVLDDHGPLLDWLEAVLGSASMSPLRAGTAALARELAASREPDAALLDVILPDGDGISLALEFRRTHPRLQVVLMTGMELSPEESAICARYDIPVLRKPFLANDAIDLLRARLVHVGSARTSGRRQ